MKIVKNIFRISKKMVREIIEWIKVLVAIMVALYASSYFMIRYRNDIMQNIFIEGTRVIWKNVMQYLLVTLFTIILNVYIWYLSIHLFINFIK